MVSAPAQSVSRPSTLRLAVSDSFDAITDEWSDLASAGRCLFGTPEFVSTWLALDDGGSQPHIVTARDDAGALHAVVPLVSQRRGPLRIVRFAGHGVADILGPVVAGDDDPLAIPILELALATAVPRWDVFLGERLRAAQGWATMSGAVVLRTEANPIVQLADWPDWDGYVGTLPSRLRAELRRDRDRLIRDHGLAVRTTSDPARLDGDLDTLFRLHRARFGERSSLAPREAFHRRFAAIALARGWLRLSILELDGRPAAARYDFSHGGVYYAYNAGRDEAWSRFSVGVVLRAHTMREAFEAGASTYRFLRGNEAYKSRYTSTDDALVTIVRARTWLGRRAVSVGRRVRRRRRWRHLLGDGPRDGSRPAGDQPG